MTSAERLIAEQAVLPLREPQSVLDATAGTAWPGKARDVLLH